MGVQKVVRACGGLAMSEFDCTLIRKRVITKNKSDNDDKINFDDDIV